MCRCVLFHAFYSWGLVGDEELREKDNQQDMDRVDFEGHEGEAARKKSGGRSQ